MAEDRRTVVVLTCGDPHNRSFDYAGRASDLCEQIHQWAGDRYAARVADTVDEAMEILRSAARAYEPERTTHTAGTMVFVSAARINEAIRLAEQWGPHIQFAVWSCGCRPSDFPTFAFLEDRIGPDTIRNLLD